MRPHRSSSRFTLATVLAVTGLAVGCGGEPTDDASDALDVVRTPRIALSQAFKLRFPIAAEGRSRIDPRWIVGQDHDGSDSGGVERCVDFAGRPAPFCYNDHEGTDFMLRGGFPTMDLVDTLVVAAAAGVVEEVDDRHYDRCHVGFGGGISCDGFPIEGNFVTILHDNGFRTQYFHLRQHSARVRVGDRVSCGAVLAVVGSSGISSMPHLHFSLEDSSRQRIDPYAGPLSQPTSYWTQQDAGDGLPSDLCAGQMLLPSCRLATVQDPVRCGTDVVTSAARCGVDTVTSAEECGTDLVESAALCGTDLVTSAERCGMQSLQGFWACAQAGFDRVWSCEIPATCSVPRTCAVPRSCEVPRTCEAPRSCDVVVCG